MLEPLRRALYFARLDQFISMRRELLAAWRAHPCPELARLLRAPPDDPDITGLRRFIRHYGYGAGRLVNDLSGVQDPRFTSILLHLLSHPDESGPLRREHIVDLWTQNRDPTGAEQMVELGGGRLEYAPLSAEEAAAVARLEGAVPLLPELEAVCREPASSAARGVLCDLLLERRDLWGELISLHLGNPSSAEEAALRVQLDRRLAEPFGYRVSVLEHDRGLPSRVRAPPFHPLRDTPAWGTVHELRFDRGAADEAGYLEAVEMARVLGLPHVGGVEALWDIPLPVLALLEPATCRIRTLGFTMASRLTAEAILKGVDRLPSVDWLELTDADIAGVSALLRSKLLRKVSLHAQGYGWKLVWNGEQVELDCVFSPDEAWRDALAVPYAKFTHLTVICRDEPKSVDWLGHGFASLTVKEPELEV